MLILVLYSNNERQIYDLLIQFFKINDPLRIAYFFLIGLIIRTIAIIWVIPLLAPEFQWMLLGEKLSEGVMLYSGLEDHIPVLSGFFYWLMSELFGRSHIAHLMLSSVLVFFHAVIFNLAINKSDLFNEKTYVPGLLYMVVTAMFADFYIVSPALLGVTFMIYAFDRLFQIIKNGNNDETAFRLGANLGLSFLFYKPMLMLCGLIIFDLLLYSNTRFRRYLISVFGFVFPVALVATFFYWNGSLGSFGKFFFLKSFSIQTLYYLSVSDVISVYLIPFVLAMLGVFILFKSTRYINIQTKSHYCFFHWLVVGCVSVVFVTEFSSFSLFVIIPPLVFFITAFFTDAKRKWLSEVYFLLFLSFVLLFSYSFKSEVWSKLRIVNTEKLILKSNTLLTKNNVLVLSDDIFLYQNHTVATNFLNWRISANYFQHLDDYDNVSLIYSELKNDMPEIIVDPKDYCNQVFKFLPTIGNHYTKVDSSYYRNY